MSSESLGFGVGENCDYSTFDDYLRIEFLGNFNKQDLIWKQPSSSLAGRCAIGGRSKIFPLNIVFPGVCIIYASVRIRARARARLICKI